VPRKVERKDFKFLSQDNELYNEHIALGAACGISPHLSVLTDTYYKIQNMQGKCRERYDEIVVYQSKRENKFIINNYCLSFTNNLFDKYRNPYAYMYTDDKKKIDQQIEKVVEANNKLGVKNINIINYYNEPQFITIPNKVEYIKEYIEKIKIRMNKSEYFTKQDAEDMFKKERIIEEKNKRRIIEENNKKILPIAKRQYEEKCKKEKENFLKSMKQYNINRDYKMYKALNNQSKKNMILKNNKNIATTKIMKRFKPTNNYQKFKYKLEDQKLKIDFSNKSKDKTKYNLNNLVHNIKQFLIK